MEELCGRCGHALSADEGQHRGKPCPKDCICPQGIRSDLFLNLQMAQLLEAVRACANCGHSAHATGPCAVEHRTTARDQNGLPIIGKPEICGCPMYVPILMAMSEGIFRLLALSTKDEDESAVAASDAIAH